MNQQAELQFLQNLCIPTMLEVLREAFIPDNNDFLSSNPSLNLSEGQLSNFAFDVLMEYLQYDIENLAKTDPAASKMRHKEKYVWESYKGLKAVMYYRIAHQLLDYEDNCLMPQRSGYFETEEDDELIRDYMSLQARKISERAATETTIEINPSAKIGKGFVIDHGIGTKVAYGGSGFSTVIGETCVIGDDCTLLNGVLLGAAVINEAASGEEGVAVGKRHPTLGDNVTVCAGVRILGSIKVGSNVTIGPCCVITSDIPDGYYISIVNQLQYSRLSDKTKRESRERRPVIHGLTTDAEGRLKLFGHRLNDCKLSIVSQESGKELEDPLLKVAVRHSSNREIVFDVEQTDYKNDRSLMRCALRIKTKSYEYVLNEPQALASYLEGAYGREEGDKE